MNLFKKYLVFLALTVCLTIDAATQKTQTQAYLEQYQGEINSEWTNSSIAKQCIRQEKKYNDSHYVFYHAQIGSLRILQDFLKELYQLLQIRTLASFEFIRPWYSNEFTPNVNTFIDDQEQGNPSNWYDNKPYLSDRLLSVNIALFGNHTNWGECTYKYFESNRSINPPLVRSAIEKVFSRFNLNQQYIEDLLALMEHKCKASLFQIFIPKKSVDTCVYLAHEWGTPYRYEIVPSCFDKDKQRHTKISLVLEKLKNNPESIKDLEVLQARILLGQNELLNPDSNIKIIRYVRDDQTNSLDSTQKLKELAHIIVADALENNEKIPNTHDTNLARLARYVMQSHDQPESVCYEKK